MVTYGGTVQIAVGLRLPSCIHSPYTIPNESGRRPTGEGFASEGGSTVEDEQAVLVLIALVGYLLGSIPTALLVVRWFAHKDITEWGTGNVGTLNVHRATNSKLLTLITFLGDALKGVVSLGVGFLSARAVGLDTEVGTAVGGIMAAVGHNYSVFLRFRGGKGIATSLPVLL